jgi:hypothetical protein
MHWDARIMLTSTSVLAFQLLFNSSKNIKIPNSQNLISKPKFGTFSIGTGAISKFLQKKCSSFTFRVKKIEFPNRILKY